MARVGLILIIGVTAVFADLCPEPVWTNFFDNFLPVWINFVIIFVLKTMSHCMLWTRWTVDYGFNPRWFQMEGSLAESLTTSSVARWMNIYIYIATSGPLRPRILVYHHHHHQYHHHRHNSPNNCSGSLRPWIPVDWKFSSEMQKRCLVRTHPCLHRPWWFSIIYITW